MPEYRELKNPDDARDAYRRQQAQDAELQAVMAEINKDAVRRLRDARPDRPLEVGSESQQSETAAAQARKRADGLRELSGIKDAEIPWDRIVATIKQQLTQEEEMLVRAADEAENAEAYAVPEADAQFRLDRQQARVDAFHATLDDLDKKATPKAKRSRTTAGGDGS